MAYIDRETAIKTAIENYKCNNQFDAIDMVEAMESIPAADVVEVVRCKDCGYMTCFKGRVMCSRNAKRINDETWSGLAVTDNEYYCSYGERIADNG